MLVGTVKHETWFDLGQYQSAWKLSLCFTFAMFTYDLLVSSLFHLFDFLNMIGFFHTFQSGFRPGDSIVMQLSENL